MKFEFLRVINIFTLETSQLANLEEVSNLNDNPSLNPLVTPAIQTKIRAKQIFCLFLISSPAKLLNFIKLELRLLFKVKKKS